MARALPIGAAYAYMGFLDNIGQGGSESRPKASRPSVPQNPIRDDTPRPVRTAPPLKLQQSNSNRVHPAAIWGGLLIVVAAVAAAAWLGIQNSAFLGSPGTEAAADAATAPAVETPVQKPSVVRPEAVVRPAPRPGNANDANILEPHVESASEASVAAVASVNQAANATETTATPFEAVSDPIVAGSPAVIPEDDYVYSSEGAGVVAPKLTSLGFVRRLVSGLRVKTSTIELIVSKSGTVERAKIFSTPAHWEDALLLSRAKTFKFVPAYRNGFPVRYRFVLDVDTSP